MQDPTAPPCSSSSSSSSSNPNPVLTASSRGSPLSGSCTVRSHGTHQCTLPRATANPGNVSSSGVRDAEVVANRPVATTPTCHGSFYPDSGTDVAAEASHRAKQTSNADVSLVAASDGVGSCPSLRCEKSGTSTTTSTGPPSSYSSSNDFSTSSTPACGGAREETAVTFTFFLFLYCSFCFN